MPWDRRRYPTDWSQIRESVQTRAGNKCERCGVPNRTFVWNVDRQTRIVISDQQIAELEARGESVTFIVCTTAHVGNQNLDPPADKHDKTDCRLEALLFLCQACHLREDIDEHRLHAAETRRRRKIETGQQVLVP